MSLRNYNLISILLIIFSIFLFFLGFYLEENSAGAGSYSGDFSNVWKSLNTFLNNGIIEAIGLTAGGDLDVYKSSRTPLLYILNKIFNPFVNSKSEFLISIFIFSLILPVLFYYFIRKKFKKIDLTLCLLITSIVLFSPYFRTSSYWGLEENYGLISLLISFIFLQILFDNPLNKKNIKPALYFFLILFSSLCVYFDHKLLIVPLICFGTILLKEKSLAYKIFSIILFLIFSLPFIYLINIWGSIIPTVDKDLRYVGQAFHFIHPGYVISIIAFYLFPLIFFKEKRVEIIIKDFFKSNFNKVCFLIFIFYLIILFLFNDFGLTYYDFGRGITHRVAVILFNNILFQEIFTYIIFLFSFFILLIFFNENKKDLLLILYFLVTSIFILPIMQEYYDPLILIFIFAFFSKNFIINFKSIFALYFYYLFFLLSANIYYQNLL
ncbi:MAG: hypothetical protein CMI79_02565 [Candidatus Pelagibacter sp.]|mgnify:CR=1 FL=1|nr:hypothetical protein [Candidatus Pelagibacter sp.]